MMETKDETIFTAEEVNEDEQVTRDVTKSDSWKSVTIGGVSGILIGAAAMHTAESQASVETVAEEMAENLQHANEGMHVAVVAQHLSFGDAFAAAREQVGAGGVFVWRGNVYGTYNAREWANMSSAEKSHYAEQAQPYIDAVAQSSFGNAIAHDAGHTAKYTEHTATHAMHIEHHTSQQSSENTAVHTQSHHAENQAYIKDVEHDDPEVHFLGMEHVRMDDGKAMNVGHMTIDDVHVALVDVDDNQVFDVSVADMNKNGRVEDEEVADISEVGITVQDFAAATQAERQMAGAPFEQASAAQDDLSTEMSNEVNDVHVVDL